MQTVESSFTLAGTWVENGSGIKYVYTRCNGGTLRWASTGTGTWDISVTPTAHGILTNIVYALDNAGNYSLTNTILLDYRSGAELSKIGSGTASFTYSGPNYILSATADAGWIFSHWEGSVVTRDNPATVATNNRQYTAVFLEDGDSDGWPLLWEGAGLDGNANRSPEIRDNKDNNGDALIDEPSTDQAYPYVFIRHPRAGSIVPAGKVTILGEDTGATSRLQYSINTISLPEDRTNVWAVYQMSKRTFSFDLILSAGTHTIYFFPSMLQAENGLGYPSRTNQISLTFQVE